MKFILHSNLTNPITFLESQMNQNSYTYVMKITIKLKGKLIWINILLGLKNNTKFLF